MDLPEAEASDFTVLTPPERSIIHSRRAFTHMIVKVKGTGNVERIHLTRATKKKGEESRIRPAGVWEKDGNSYLHYRLPLRPGKNIFEVDPGDYKTRITYKPLRSLLNVKLDSPKIHVFHREEVNPPECAICHDKNLPKDTKIIRPRYGPFSPLCYSCHRAVTEMSTWKHSPVLSVFCRSCHQEDPAVDKITLPLGKVDDLCFTCHMNQRGWQSEAHVHGPVGTGDCTVCHNPHGDKYKFQLWEAGEKELCVACHRDKMPLIAAESPIFIHGILISMGCVPCHDPHATPYRFQLRKPLVDLCVGCHPQFVGMERGHPVDKHPLRGEKDPLREGHEFNCTSCHNPHGTRYKYMLIGDLVGEKVCVTCHARQGKSVEKFKKRSLEAK
ncbi:cytochrome c3 family protein [Thermodesulfobacteriota bacterium]